MLPTIGLLQADSKQALVDIIRYHNREVFPHSRVNVDTITVSAPTVVSGKRTRVTITPNLKSPGYERTAVNSFNFTYNRLHLNEVFSGVSGNDWVIEKPITTEKILAKLKEVVNFKHAKDEFVTKAFFNDTTSFVLEASPTSLRWYGSVTISFTPENSLANQISINYLLGLVNRVFISPINGYINKLFLKGLEYKLIPNSIEGTITKHILKGLKNRNLSPPVSTFVNQTLLTNYNGQNSMTMDINTVLHKNIMEGHVIYTGNTSTLVSDITQDGLTELRAVIENSMEIPVSGFTVENISSVESFWNQRAQADVVGVLVEGITGTKRVYFERVDIESILGNDVAVAVSQTDNLTLTTQEINTALSTQAVLFDYLQLSSTEWLATVADNDPMFYGALNITVDENITPPDPNIVPDMSGLNDPVSGDKEYIL